MTKIDLPADIKTAAKKNIFKKVAKFVFSEGIFLIFIFIICYFLLSGATTIVRITLAIILIAISVWVTDLPNVLSDHDLCGEVIKVEIKSGMAAHNTFGRLKLHGEDTIVVTLRTDRGAIKEKDVVKVPYQFVKRHAANLSFEEGRLDALIDSFNVGDRVYCFRGLDYAFVVPKKRRERCNCVVCGQANSSRDDVCWNCEHSLIKIEGENN